MPAADALAAAGIRPVELEEKEGLALINGTDGMLGMLCLAIHDLRELLVVADVAAAMSVEGLLGTDDVFAADLHALRPQPGQAVSAANIRKVMAHSEIRESATAPRRAPASRTPTRCAAPPRWPAAPATPSTTPPASPAGSSRRAVDNPVVTPDGRVESNGNFHGAPVAYVLDFLAIVAADVASISERRTDRFLDVARSHGLPPFLADDPGVDSGHMIAQYTQAAIVSEMKRLAAPASVDSIPSSAMQEDHVSMGWSAARKLRRAVDGLARVLAIEVLTAARGIELRAPLAPAPATAAVVEALVERGRRPPRSRPLPRPRDRHRSPPRHRRHGPPRRRVRDRPPRPDPTAASAETVAPATTCAPDSRETENDMDGARPVRSPRGTTLTARQWSTEAPLRMLMNNLDPEVAERPDDLVVYGGTGRAARDWRPSTRWSAPSRRSRPTRRCSCSRGRPVGVMQTHEWAPRVLIANSNLVGDWATWPEFRRLEHLGLTMYGQMTAGSWIYIGTQGIVQGTYETFAAVAEKRFGGTLAGTLTLTGGCGGMGGAQPLAVTLNEGVCLIVDVDPSRLHRRVEHRYLDEVADDLDDAVEKALRAKAERRAWSVGVVGNAAEVFPELLRRGVPIDIVTDQTSAHDPLSLPARGGRRSRSGPSYAEKKPEEFTDRARASMAKHVQAMVDFMDAGAEVFDYGNSIRDEARQGGCERAFDFPGFVPAYIRPLFCEGKGPFRWAALSGDPKDIAATDRAVLDLFPDNDRLHKWMRGAQERIAFQGLPARICWLGQGERDKAGLAFNDLVRTGAVQRPDRHRPRPPRHRVGRQPLPRDRVDARRLRRHRRLAAAQRAGQHRVRRQLGLDPPRRRGRHRPLAARRPGLPRRRHRPRGAEARPGAHQRPGDGRHPARRRGLRHRRAHRAGAGRPHPDARGLTAAMRARGWAGTQPESGPGQAGSVTSATSAPRARDAASASTVAATPCAPAPSDTVRPVIVASATTGHAVRRPERRDRAALVAGDLERGRGVRHRHPVDAQVRAQLGPRDLAVAGHEHEEEVALAAAHHEGLDDVARARPRAPPPPPRATRPARAGSRRARCRMP